MTGEFLSLLSAIVWATAVIFFRISVKGVSPLFLNLFKNTLASVLFVITWLAVGCPMEHMDLTNTGMIILSSVIGISLGDTFFLRSINILGAGRNAIVSCFYSPTVVLLSILFLGENLTWAKGAGFALVVGGVILASYQRGDKDISSKDMVWGIIFGITATTFMSIGMVMMKPVVNDASIVSVSAVRFVTASISLLIYYAIAGKWKDISATIHNKSLNWKAMFIGSFLGAYLAVFIWVAGFKYTAVSTASVLNQTSIFFTLILSAFILHEKPSVLKTIGACLGFSGVITILLL